jgi:hypothetical protein
MCQERKRLIIAISKKTTSNLIAQMMSASQVINACRSPWKKIQGRQNQRDHKADNKYSMQPVVKPLLEHLISIVIRRIKQDAIESQTLFDF